MATHSYYVVMIDLGKRGLEAVVQPEITRREVISRIASGEYPKDAIEFIHFIVNSRYIEDVTQDIFDEVEALDFADDFEAVRIDRQAADFDHARDLRKHEVV